MEKLVSFAFPRLAFRHYLWASAAVLLTLLLVFAFLPRPVTVQLAEVTRGEVRVEVRDEGRTRITEFYLVSAPQTGRLLRVGNLAGESVEAGEIVAEILPTEPLLLDPRSRAEAEAALRVASAAQSFAEAGLAEAESALGLARRDAERTETLFDRGVSSQAALDRARTELTAAQNRRDAAAAAVARAAAERTGAAMRLNPPTTGRSEPGLIEIRAPASGRILRVMQESESIVAAGAPILEIGDPERLEIVAEFLSEDAVRIAEGAPVRIDAWGGEAPLEGRVRLVEPSGFRKISALGIEEQRVNVIIDIADNTDVLEVARLGHGYRVETSVLIWSGDDELRVPVAALVRDGEDWAVFRAEGGRARLTPVRIGRQDFLHASVLDGLSPGDQVVIYPSRELRPDAHIRTDLPLRP